MNNVEKFAENYKQFVSKCKTEYEVAQEFVEIAKQNGFVNLEEKDKIEVGDKIYWVFDDRLCMFAKISDTEELRLIGVHSDSPRLELKLKPFEDKKDLNIGVMKIGFYGGIAPYIWLNHPLELRGVIYYNGEKKFVKIKNLVISDHLIHLSRKRLEERKAEEVIKWEEMKVLSVLGNQEKDLKKKMLEIISKEVGIELEEKDFIKANFVLVPSYEAMDIGLDKSMIGAYGHDDKSLCFASFAALLEANVKNTSMLVVVDKEEIGSESRTSIRSEAVRYFIEELLNKAGNNKIRKTLLKSKAISADVTAAVAPGFEDVYDIENSAKLGKGVVIERFHSYAGKYYQNEASLKFTEWIVNKLDANNIPWQAAVLVSKTDPKMGGGGTISSFMARFGMNVIDIAIPTIGMHTPLEIIAKSDLHAAFRAFKVFYES